MAGHLLTRIGVNDVGLAIAWKSLNPEDSATLARGYDLLDSIDPYFEGFNKPIQDR